MSIVQVALSFAVEIWKFHNIDLFHQGAFQIRSYFKNNGPSPALIENPKIWDRSKNISFPECTQKSFVSPADPKLNIPSKAVSKSVLIIYKEESLRMYDIFEQTMHLQIDALSIDELIYKSEIVLVVELWFGEKRNEIIEEMKCVCERQLKIHLIPSQGLHHHITVIFDYYYLAAVELVVHASLVSISPCYLRLPQTVNGEPDSSFERNVSLYQSWHSILFSSAKNCGRRHTACLVHTHLCKLLLSVIDSLMNTFHEALSFLNEDQKSIIDDKLQSQLCPNQRKKSIADWMRFAPNELERLAFILQAQTSEDDIADQASIDITKLSSRIVVLFNEYLKTASFHQPYVESLSLRTHKLRIKRFSEAFFFQESSIVHLLAVYDPKYANPTMYLSQPSLPPAPSNNGRGRPSYHAHRSNQYNRSKTASQPTDNGAAANDDDSDSVASLSSGSSSSSLDTLHKYDYSLTTRSSATLVRRGSTYNAFVPFSMSSHETLANKVRESVYYRRLPPLPIECPDTDGESHDQPIILEEIFMPESKRSTTSISSVLSTVGGSIRSSDSSSGSDADGTRSRVSRNDGSSLSSSSIYKKKRPANKYEPSSIPVMRKLNPAFNSKHLPIQQKKVNLVGYRSVDSSAFEDNVHRLSSTGGISVGLSNSNQTDSRQGIGTLKTVNGLSSFNMASNNRKDVEVIKSLSCSMPDLSNIGTKIKMRKNRDIKKRTQSWNCMGRDLSRSNCNLACTSPDSSSLTNHNPAAEDDANSEKLTILEMLSSSRLPRPASAYVYSQSSSSYSNHCPDATDSQISNKLQMDRVQQRNLSKSTEIPSLSQSLTQLHQPDTILNEQVTFHQLKAKLMADLSPQFQGNVYSEMSNIPASKQPYFSLRDRDDLASSSPLHYIICVHGLDGEHRDLRLVRAYLILALPEQRFEFMMSEANELNTFADIDTMKENLVDEILDKISDLRDRPDKISFIGHSLGCVLIRAAIASPRLSSLIPKFHTFLSLGGPHLGTVYGSSVLVNVGLWVMQKVRKSICLQQLAMKDCPTDLRQSYLYQLSGQSGLEYFKYVLLASSPQDRYVPYHSTRIELCKAAVKDNSEMGVVYMEMVTRILQRLLRSGKTTVIRYDANYTLPRSANNYIGRAAHIALIDSELFLEKFICVSAAKYFR